VSGVDDRIPRGTAVFSSLAVVHFDGACEPPRGGGLATYGFTVEGDGLAYEERGLAVRPGAAHATNNVAEYSAAIRALEWLRGRGFRGTVILVGDSQLVLRQATGEYAVHAEHLRAYREHLLALVTNFSDVQFRWVPRSENARADALTKLAIEEAREAGARPAPESSDEDATKGR
jgi:ribonuclease HI